MAFLKPPCWIWLWRGLSLFLILSVPALGQNETESPLAPKSVLPLYHELRTVKLDPSNIYKVREATIDRDDLHIFLNDGLLIFTSSVQGRITGMYFEGDGEVLVRPPNRTERESLGLFTNLGVLEDHFGFAYFRFNDDVFAEMKPYLRPPGDADVSKLSQFDAAAEQLADVDALRLLTSFTRGPSTDMKGRNLVSDHFLHARVAGSQFGGYDLFYDSRAPEQIAIAQMAKNGSTYFYDLWMSFQARKVREHKADGVVPLRTADAVHIAKCRIEATIQPPKNISAEADMEVDVRQGGNRILFFELSHQLALKQVKLDDTAVEWIQNEAIQGTQLARSGNDFAVVVLPAPSKAGDRLHLHFTYEGSVLSQAGNGLLFVGAHGIWYPNRGLTPSLYDLKFTYPQPWTLVATGKKISEEQNGNMRTSHWTSDLPMPVAGFNLGEYVEARDKVGDIDVAAYATRSVEKDFPTTAQTQSVQKPRSPWRAPQLSEVTTPINIDPSKTTQQVAQQAAEAIQFYSKLLGPYPFSTLKLTQFPGPESQGWPGLIYLSSYTFLTPEQRRQLGMSDFVQAFFGKLMLRHEVAHMWWGHQVFWESYRDQWLSEALSNYSALLISEQNEPEKFRILMEGYRDQLMSKREGGELYEAGPVTLGLRLNSAKFPDAYEAVAYGRGTWLIHMLRCMLEDETRTTKGRSKVSGDDLFIQVLRTLLQRYRDAGMSTDDVRRAFEEVWPESLRFEGHKSLDWFFDGWVNGNAMPALELGGVKITKQGEEEFVTGTIKQKYAPDDLVTSVPVYAQTADRLEYLGRVFAVGSETRFRLRMRGAARKIVLDPNHTVLTRP